MKNKANEKNDNKYIEMPIYNHSEKEPLLPYDERRYETKIKSKNETYEGEVIYDGDNVLKDGHGTVKRTRGKRKTAYTGGFKKDKFDGKGIYVCKDGVYEGKIRNGIPDGTVKVYLNRDGSAYNLKIRNGETTSISEDEHDNMLNLMSRNKDVEQMNKYVK